MKSTWKSASTDIGTLFLDRQLCIRRYTPPVAQVFNFVVTDVGRPIFDVTHRLDYDELEDDARAVLKSLTRIEREVTARDGRWFRLSSFTVIPDDAVGLREFGEALISGIERCLLPVNKQVAVCVDFHFGFGLGARHCRW